LIVKQMPPSPMPAATPGGGSLQPWQPSPLHALPAPPRHAAHTARGPRSRGIVLLIGSAMILSALPMVAAARGPDEVLLCTIGVLAFLAAAAPILLRRDYDFFEPITFVAATTFVGVTLKTFYIAFVDDQTARDYVLLGRPVSFLLGHGILITVALLFFSLGYLLRIPRLPLEKFGLFRRDAWSLPRLLLLSGMFLAVSVVSTITFVRKMGIVVEDLSDVSSKRFYDLEIDGVSYGHTTFGYLAWGALLVIPVYYLFLTWFLASGRKVRTMPGLVLGLLGIASVVFPFMNSSRTVAVTVLVTTLIIHAYMRRRVPVGSLAAIGLVMITLFMTMTALRKKVDDLGGIADYLQISAVIDGTVGSRKFLDIAKTAHIIDAIPEKFPYMYGSTLVRWVAMPIPRTLWPEKPTLGIGPELGPVVFGTSGAGVPPGIIAEMYLNFGLLGVLAGMFAFGVFLRFFYRSFAPTLTTRNGLVLYAVLVLPLAYGVLVTDIGKVIVRVLVTGLPIILALLFVTRGSRQVGR
jgi:oligosaccharide repeat unit polymerase